MVATVGFKNPLHHDLPPFMFKVHVNVGRFASLFADKAFEQQVIATGIDRGDPEHIADGRIRGGAASLAQDVA